MALTKRKSEFYGTPSILKKSDGTEIQTTSEGIIHILVTDIHLALKQIINILTRPIWTDPTTGRLNINNATSVTTVTTVTTAADITRLNYLGATSATQQPALYVMLYGQERLNWANSVRRNIE